MRTRTTWAWLFAVMLLAAAAVAQPPKPMTNMGSVVIINDHNLVIDTGTGQMTLKVDSVLDPKSTFDGARTTNADNQPQTGGPLRLIALAALVLLTTGVGLHAWYDRSTNNLTL